MKKSSKKLSPTEQSKRFIEKARELGCDETEAGQEKAFGKSGQRSRRQSTSRASEASTCLELRR